MIFVLKFIRQLGHLLERLIAPTRWLALVMVITTFAIVLLRYALETGSVAMQELVMYLHGLLFLLAIPSGVANNSHVRVDILYSRLSERVQQRLDLAGHMIFLLPVAGFMFFISLPYVASSWSILEGSSEVGGLPGIFLLKTLLPLCALCLFIQGLAAIAQILLDWLQADRALPNDVSFDQSDSPK